MDCSARTHRYRQRMQIPTASNRTNKADLSSLPSSLADDHERGTILRGGHYRPVTGPPSDRALKRRSLSRRYGLPSSLVLIILSSFTPRISAQFSTPAFAHTHIFGSCRAALWE